MPSIARDGGGDCAERAAPWAAAESAELSANQRSEFIFRERHRQTERELRERGSREGGRREEGRGRQTGRQADWAREERARARAKSSETARRLLCHDAAPLQLLLFLSSMRRVIGAMMSRTFLL